MRSRRFIIAGLLGCSLWLGFAPTASAGPLLDWLFRRNRSQGLAGGAFGANPNAYQNGYAANAASNAATTFRGQNNGFGLGSCCLFGRSRNATAWASNRNGQRPNNNALAAGQGGAANGYGAQGAAGYGTSGYGPGGYGAGNNAQFASANTGGGCQAGWCRETVLRYVPQVAYKTVSQRVPVTTYRTTTTLNPQTGLPRTCTRPCTSYSYQPRRVPYTTYRPVYTTVPVADTFGGSQAGFAQSPANAGYAPTNNPALQQRANPNFAFQSPTQFAPGFTPYGATSQGGCSACQNGPTAPQSYGGNLNGTLGNSAPGYTPGNATGLPPAPIYGPWSTQPLPGSGSAPFGGSGQLGSGQFGAGNSGTSSPFGSSDPRATEWQQVPRDGLIPGPPGSGVEADNPPRLRPDYSDYGYGSNYRSNYGSESFGSSHSHSSNYGGTYSPGTMQQVPLPDSVRRQFSNKPRSPRRIDSNATDLNQPQSRIGTPRAPQSTTPRFGIEPQSPRGLITSGEDQLVGPNRSVPNTSTDRNVSGPFPSLSPPANNTAPRGTQFRFDSRAIPDRFRERGLPSSELNYSPLNDNTARRAVPERPMRAESSTRYAAVPIDWSAPGRIGNRPEADAGPTRRNSFRDAGYRDVQTNRNTRSSWRAVDDAPPSSGWKSVR